MNNIAGPLDVADARDIAGMLVKLGQAVDPREWVDELVAERESEKLAGLW